MIAVAVITRPGSDTLDGCLAALREAGVPAPDVVEIGPLGPAMARNRALSRCRDTVLALVEDDILVAPGWLAALREAWTDALVAVAGGPIAGREPQVTGPSPTYPGGNVAFRASALRGAGGFWPARGDPAERDWFSEEHEAQRELARIGWRAAYVPGMEAQRIGPAPSLAQRLKTGARRRAVGDPRPPAEAARALMTGLGGAALGNRRERLGRAAENLGVLVGPWAVAGDLAPVVTQTPFLASVPPAAPRAGARAAARRLLPLRLRASAPVQRPQILAYHRIAELEPDPLSLAVSPAHFAEHLAALGDREIVDLEAIASRQAPPRSVALTFDDGYADNYAPLLGLRAPATLFVATGAVQQRATFWWDRVSAACRERRGETVAIEDREFVLGPAAIKPITRWLQPRAPEEIAAAITLLRAPEAAPTLTASQVRELSAHVAIGAHTRSHRSLHHATPEEQREEIEGSRDDVERMTGRRPSAFAYPFGVPGESFGPVTRRLVREAGFRCAVANGPSPEAGPFSLPRVSVPDVDGDGLVRLLG